MSEQRDLAGTVIAITGATSGIGQASAIALLELRARVIISGRRQERLEELEQRFGSDRVAVVPGPIEDPETSRRIVEAAESRFGRLDSIVAAAGIGAYGGVEDLTDDEVTDMISVNYSGTVWFIRAAVPALDGGGDIVVIASVAGQRGGANEAVYAGTKAAQLVFAGAVDRELQPRGIRVTTLCPAAVNTEFAIGRGRTENDPWLDDVMAADDVAAAVVAVLQQPRRLRTTVWSMWSAAEAS